MSISNNDFQYIREILRKQVGIVLETDKRHWVETRLMVLAQQRGLSSWQELLLQWRTQANVHQDVVDAIAINETRFFRDDSLFETLKTTILPEMTKQRTLNIWCAACSSGQEPYSIAMLLQRYLPKLCEVRLIASDISTTMLTRAREGRYTEFEVKRGLPLPLLNKHFHHQGKEWQINEDIRQMVEFREINLAETWPLLPLIDILLLRNVLIYFDDTTKKSILNKALNILNPNGYLFVGAPETGVTRMNNQFKTVRLGGTIAYQKV